MTSESNLSGIQLPFPPLPIHIHGVSGLYFLPQRIINIPFPPLPPVPPIPPIPPVQPGAGPVAPSPASQEPSGGPGPLVSGRPIRLGYGAELRLDVDGYYPQQVASGVLWSGMSAGAAWVAHVANTGRLTWSGSIFYKDGATSILPFTSVSITVHQQNPFLAPALATLVFSGGGATNLTLELAYQSPYFHDLQMEFDTVAGTTAMTSYDTCSHPNRPATLPCETLTIETAYRRAGFNVIKSGGDGSIPLTGAGNDQDWSITEMNDAMATYWSKFSSYPQWSEWTLFASMSDQGSGLGGIMFDYSGTTQRQGCAIFENAFISQPPAGEAQPDEWVHRMRFWTACHEIGHTLNLAHSWVESQTSGGHGPWIPLSDEPEGRTFMNYPYNVNGGTSAFFSDFAYRFSDQELLFLRHAPARFVEPGNADWFDQHGFRQASVSAEPQLALQVRAHRSSMTYSFLEPVYLELKLANISGSPVLVDENILLNQEAMTVIVKRRGDRARQRLPHARYCMQRVTRALQPDEALYESVLVSVSRDGWEIAEPGRYLVQVALRLPSGEDVVSNVLTLRVSPPASRAEEVLAGDFFDIDVARTLASGGTRVMTDAIDTLEEMAGRLGKHPVARHAQLALGRPFARPFKLIDTGAAQAQPTSVVATGGQISVLPADLTRAGERMGNALADGEAAADTLGHIHYRRAVDRLATVLTEQGADTSAVRALDDAQNVLSKRGVLPSVLAQLETRKTALAAEQGDAKDNQ